MPLLEANTHLPEDYKDFLRVTNGLDNDDEEHLPLIFLPTEKVGIQTSEMQFLREQNWTLFPSSFISPTRKINLIPFGHSFRAIHIGGNPTDSPLILVPPSSTAPILAAFREQYAKAWDKEKHMYDRAVLETFGSPRALEDVGWMVVWFNVEYGDASVWATFREYLERVVAVVVEREDDLGVDLEMRRRGELDDDGMIIRKARE